MIKLRQNSVARYRDFFVCSRHNNRFLFPASLRKRTKSSRKEDGENRKENNNDNKYLKKTKQTTTTTTTTTKKEQKRTNKTKTRYLYWHLRVMLCLIYLHSTLRRYPKPSQLKYYVTVLEIIP